MPKTEKQSKTQKKPYAKKSDDDIRKEIIAEKLRDIQATGHSSFEGYFLSHHKAIDIEIARDVVERDVLQAEDMISLTKKEQKKYVGASWKFIMEEEPKDCKFIHTIRHGYEAVTMSIFAIDEYQVMVWGCQCTKPGLGLNMHLKSAIDFAKSVNCKSVIIDSGFLVCDPKKSGDETACFQYVALK